MAREKKLMNRTYVNLVKNAQNLILEDDERKYFME